MEEFSIQAATEVRFQKSIAIHLMIWNTDWKVCYVNNFNIQIMDNLNLVRYSDDIQLADNSTDGLLLTISVLEYSAI